MKILGIEFTTKKELREQVDSLNKAQSTLIEQIAEIKKVFPLNIGETVYEVILKDDQGKYTKTKPSIDHSSVSGVVVTEKNYFNLVKRYNAKEVFFNAADAGKKLKNLCK